MSEAPVTPCATCGACCRSYLVPLCGHDVWLISTRQRLSPESFVVAVSQQHPTADGFVLEPGSAPFGLALDKRGPFAPKEPCVFLLRLAGGNERCGVYEDRPVVCRGYPMTMWSGAVHERGDALCPPASWPDAEVRAPGWRDALQRLRLAYDIYDEVVARWNARVAATARCCSLAEYLGYLLSVYDRLAALDSELGEMVMARVRATWPTAPRPTLEASASDLRDAAEPWLDYLGRARAVIDAFYPELAALPVRLLATGAAELALVAPVGTEASAAWRGDVLA